MRRLVRPTWSATRTAACPRLSSAASTASSPSRTAPGPPPSAAPTTRTSSADPTLRRRRLDLEDSGGTQAPTADRVECLVRGPEGIELDLGADRHLRRQRH